MSRGGVALTRRTGQCDTRDVCKCVWLNDTCGAGHWSTTIDVEPWQLFVALRGELEGELYVNARWPNGDFNGRWDCKSIFKGEPGSSQGEPPVVRSTWVGALTCVRGSRDLETRCNPPQR